MNREELEDLKITKISEEEYERLKGSDEEGEAMEVSIDSLKAEQEKLKESESLLDEAKKAFSAYWFLLSLFIGQNLCLGAVLYQIYSAWSKEEPFGFMVLCAISIIVAASYSWNAIRPYRERYKNYKQVRIAYSRLVEANRAVLELLEYVESKPKEERAEEAEELAEPVVMAVAELFFARMAYTRALKEGLELQ
jgi:hypothetical protein